MAEHIEAFPLLEVIVSVVISLIASSGFWVYIGRRFERRSLQTELLIGLAHDRIIYLCDKHIKKGFISRDEYEDLITYLYRPYEQLGGNGTARRLMTEVDKLPIRNSNNITQENIR